MKLRSIAAHMIDMTYTWANAAVLMAAFVFVQVRLWLFAPGCLSTERGQSGTAVDFEDWQHVLYWKLKAGSHPFPGRSGGTCINEAALIAAGFDYRPIRSAEEMPESFSRPICQLAMILNDTATDEERQRLLPYVKRLACADVSAIERKRASYINRRTLYGLLVPRFETGLKMLDRAIEIGRQHENGYRCSDRKRTGAGVEIDA
jgi:hypothetical protein